MKIFMVNLIHLLSHNLKWMMFNLLQQSDWLAGEFRDCNGESNGLELPVDVLREEGNCSDNKAGSNKTSRQSNANEIRIQPLVWIKLLTNQFSCIIFDRLNREIFTSHRLHIPQSLRPRQGITSEA